ncbi:glycosyltransferase family 4 protein [Coraliomargarita sp. SDUM461004]|uniref:Glycosyltransferase family 4 protein n=1 Tax=Thalassobacterium sedimentorum TaxID=3041258 RepID=A0ABU1AN19_9BACT|nr:glycosyltransferase family 4 protein [Coraliomargarita sp. SDUM461004]MDQ8195588.1 glycosyltransferase family 4 protein [Coraliomargarita sp. SDUM461004]
MRTDIAVAWNGLPAYAARLIRAAQDDVGSFPVLGTRPTVPIEGMEAILGQSIHWLDADSSPTWKSLGLPVPKIYFQTGWGHSPLNALGAEVRNAGGQVIGMVDSFWNGSLRQIGALLLFRLKYRKWYSALMVPGRRSRRFCRALGMPVSRIYTGMYGADSELFNCQQPLSQRTKRFLFVGQLIDRKGVLELAEAYSALGGLSSGWTLTIVGEGPLRAKLEQFGDIDLRSFTQPDSVAELLSDTRCLVLPSKFERWGLVVHEAALAGCQLILTEAVGSWPDLLRSGENGYLCHSGSLSELKGALTYMMNRKDCAGQQATAVSKQLASQFGPRVWSTTMQDILTAES